MLKKALIIKAINQDRANLLEFLIKKVEMKYNRYLAKKQVLNK